MRHPGEGELQAYLDGELERENASRVEEHLVGCAACRDELSVLRRAAGAFRGAVRDLDAAATEVRVEPWGEIVHAGRRPRPAWGTLARAAVLILAVVGAAAALVPGSPVRAWLDGLLAVDGAPVAVSEPEPAVAPTSPPGPAAVLVPVENGRVAVDLTGFAPESRVQVRLTGVPSATVRVTGTASRPRFIVAPGRVEAEGSGVATIQVELPRAAEWAAVRVDGSVVVVLRAGRLQLRGAVLDTLTEEVRFPVGR